MFKKTRNNEVSWIFVMNKDIANSDILNYFMRWFKRPTDPDNGRLPHLELVLLPVDNDGGDLLVHEDEDRPWTQANNSSYSVRSFGWFRCMWLMTLLQSSIRRIRKIEGNGRKFRHNKQ